MLRYVSNAITLAAYRSQANGAAETIIQTVKRFLPSMISGKVQKWDAALEAIESTYRSHRTADGFFVFWLMLVTNLRSVIHDGFGSPFKYLDWQLDITSRKVLLTDLKDHWASQMVAKSIVGSPFQVEDIVSMKLSCLIANDALKLHRAGPLVFSRANDARC